MAEKKSFVMYTSWEKAISKMTNEQAGQLLKAIYAYQSDPSAEPEDMAVDLVFEIIKQKFDEDSERYQRACDAKSEAAKKGNHMRKKDHITEGETAYASNTEDMRGYASNTADMSASEGDTESVSESDTESVADTESEAEAKNESGKEKERPLKRPSSRRTAREAKAEQNTEMLLRLSGSHGYSDEVMQKLLEWMRYKGKDKSFAYGETGMNSLLATLDANIREHGEKAVIAEITLDMGNGWQGIQWDRLNASQGRQRPQASNYSDLMEAW